MPTVDDCQLVTLPKISDHRGNLTFAEGDRHIPFPVARAFWIYDIPSGVSRGAHAHRALQQFLVCLSGGLDVQLDDGTRQRTVHLNRPWIGLHIPPMIWASEGNFDTNTAYVVFASAAYDESDYFRDYADFLAAVGGGR
jgi:hypothetical protein